MNIVLYQPEIPANTGNIGRTCVATGSVLHLIEPLGFRLTGKELRRAGMDYWEHLDVRRYMNFTEFVEKNLTNHPDTKLWMATTKAKKVYTQAQFGESDYIMFGKESAGIPEEILVEYEQTCIRIPMLDTIRSLNLSNSVSIVLYEALRQQNFVGMQKEGALHHLDWLGTQLDLTKTVCRHIIRADTITGKLWRMELMGEYKIQISGCLALVTLRGPNSYRGGN